MRVRHFPEDSAMSRYWRVGDVFHLCDDAGNVLMTYSGAQLLALIASSRAQAQVVLDMAGGLVEHLGRVTPKRRLLGQHKPLRGQDPLLAPQMPRRLGKSAHNGS